MLWGMKRTYFLSAKCCVFWFMAAVVAAVPALGTEYFVAPDGDNRANGLSESTPWQTVEHAMRRADEGGTITMLEGVYGEELRSNRRPANLTIQGRGLVRIAAQWRQSSINNLTLRNLQFDVGLTVSRGQALTIDNCTFATEAPLEIGRVEGITLRHCLLLGQMDMRQSKAIDVSDCIFGERVTPRISTLRAIKSSDNNSFANLKRAWRFGPGGVGVRHQFSTVAGGEEGAGMDRNSIEVTPEVSTDVYGRIILLNQLVFGNKGPEGQ